MAAVERIQICIFRNITLHGVVELGRADVKKKKKLISLSVLSEGGTPGTDPVWPALSGATLVVK